jgi:hypothetical protein
LTASRRLPVARLAATRTALGHRSAELGSFSLGRS